MATPPSGILPLHKPEGPTSHDMVALARRSLGIRRIGHGGTLDPLAEGLLLLLVGEATRWFDALRHHPKSYLATIRLGERTDSGDRAGAVVARSEVPPLASADIERALAPLRGRIEQRIPAYSAAKHRGEAFHRIARRGETPPERLAPTQVHRLALESWDTPQATVTAVVSSGTYLRALAEAFGRRLGVPAHLRALVRTRIGPFRVEDALGADALRGMDRTGLLEHLQGLEGARHSR
ncbi:MAG: tRNA pseudouridine(55) synthase TruB [Planctomycetes bacterium]|nr:tRNA pseudouridine(55) synthase TruB [Planctomycetota bacterium]